MASNQSLTAAEWYKFLVDEVKLPVNAKVTIEKLAQGLEDNYMIEEDFINLSEDDLRTMFDVHQIGLLNRFTRWKNSRTGQTSNSSSSSSATNDTPSVQQDNPLLSLVDIFKTPINQGQIDTAQSLLGSDPSNVHAIVSNYQSAIDNFIGFGNLMVPEKNRTYYRCKACDRQVCQRNWLAGLCRLVR